MHRKLNSPSRLSVVPLLSHRKSMTATSLMDFVDFDVVRSEANILRWMEYLPQDCIDTMIRLGWDVST